MLEMSSEHRKIADFRRMLFYSPNHQRSRQLTMYYTRDLVNHLKVDVSDGHRSKIANFSTFHHFTIYPLAVVHEVESYFGSSKLSQRTFFDPRVPGKSLLTRSCDQFRRKSHHGTRNTVPGVLRRSWAATVVKYRYKVA